MFIRVTGLIYIISKVMSSAQANYCSYLGDFNKQTNSCVCDDGWTGTQCNQLDFENIPEQISSYTAGVWDPNYKTWGGSMIPANLEETEFFWIGSTLPNKKGMSCWAFDSMPEIWLGKNESGPWDPISMIGFGNLTDHNPYDIPFAHCLKIGLEKNLVNESFKYALRIDGIFKSYIGSNVFLNANLGAPNSKFCSNSDLIPFPIANQKQGLVVGYKKLKATKYADVFAEIREILMQSTLVPNVNGYPRNAYVNTEFTWLPLDKKIVNYYPSTPNTNFNAVNPDPCKDITDNSIALIPGLDGNLYKLYVYRFSAQTTLIKFRYLPANQSIWDKNAMYLQAQDMSWGWYTEDPFCFVDQKGRAVHLIQHDTLTCGKKNGRVCGSLTHYPLHNPPANIFDPQAKQYWTTPTPLYADKIPGLKITAKYRQTPHLYKKGSQLILFTGTIFNHRKQLSHNTNGNSLNYPVKTKNKAKCGLR